MSDRLSAEQLRFLRQDVDAAQHAVDRIRERLNEALAELRDRRAADLTFDDRRGLRYLEQLLADRGCKCGACGAAPAKSVLDKLIGGKS